MNVKETKNLKEDSTTNGPQGTVSQETQTSIELLLNGVNSLMSKVTNVNPNYKDTIDWKTLLTTIVENLHAVYHFKHETFDALQYATDFGTISKESLKRITKCGAKYFTHRSSYYPVQPWDWNVVQGCQVFHLLLMCFLKGRNRQWKIGWRTTILCVRDPWGARLLKIWHELFLRQCIQTHILMLVQGSFFQLPKLNKRPLPSLRCALLFPICVVLSFVSDATVPQLTLMSTADFKQAEEYESDSDDSDNDVDIESEELVIGKPIVTRSGRQVKVWTKFDMKI